jgi:3-oxoacyl-(acyl-carrier-protein) synthase
VGYVAALVAASNAGGAGSVIGDTTTTMMWIDGVSPLAVLHAYVTGSGQQGLEGLEEHDLRRRLRTVLPEVMVPSAVQVLPAMPLLPNGKLDRSALPLPGSAGDAALEAAVEAAIPSADGGTAAASPARRTHAIIEAWAAVLGHRRFGLRDNFFDVGGHSLLLMRVHARLQAHFGPTLSLMDLFAHPSVEALAGHLAGNTGSAPARPHDAGPPPAPAPRKGLAVAVIGMACRVPGAPDLESFWDQLVAGRDGISRLSEEELLAAGEFPERLSNPRYVPAYGTLQDADAFDAALFDVPPSEAQVLDPQHRVFLECAWAALEHAGYSPRGGPRPCGVFAGSGMNTYALNHLYAQPELIAQRGPFAMLLATDKDFLASRVAYKLDLRGPALGVQTACSTSLVAIAMAARAVARGDCEMALAGGVTVRFPQAQGHVHEDGMILSADGCTRAFDAQATGAVFGSGVGAVVLKRLDQALADGDTVHAVIEGVGLNNDGAAKAGYSAPGVTGQVQVIEAALADAGVSPRTIGLLEAHGTGTALGDPIEVSALKQAWGRHTADTGFCALGSVKANVGHLDAAAGVTGFIKAVLSVSRGVRPGQIHFTQANPELGLEASPFFVPTQSQPWTCASARRAGVSAFGIGGTNAHLILRQGPEPILHDDPAATVDRLLLGLSESFPRSGLHYWVTAVHAAGHLG